MALKSLRVTKKELQTYYTPKVSDYEMMVNSINSNMGYGQIIQAYTSTETGVEVLTAKGAVSPSAPWNRG